MAGSTFVSHIEVDKSIAENTVPAADFVPNSGNLYPKWPGQIDKDSWDEWQIQGMAADGSAAIVLVFFRHTGEAPAGFRVGMNASWADGTVWCGHVVLPHSVITSEGGSEPDRGGKITAVWRTAQEDEGPSVGFAVAADLSHAVATINIPGKVVGTVQLASHGFASLPKTADEARFMSSFWWLRPIASASVNADVTFFPQDPVPPGQIDTPKAIQLRAEDGAFGSLERAWSSIPMPKTFSHSWWLWAKAGPYLIQIIWILGRPEEDQALWGTGRLYRDGELISAPQRAVHPEEGDRDSTGKGPGGDTLTLEYLHDENGIPGAFRLRHTGQRLTFRSNSGGRRTAWSFVSRHKRAWYNLPSSPPGPNATGLSGFVLSVSGGLAGSAEAFEGPGIIGGGTVQ